MYAIEASCCNVAMCNAAFFRTRRIVVLVHVEPRRAENGVFGYREKGQTARRRKGKGERYAKILVSHLS